MPLQVYKGYTVDYRLREFRLVHPGDCMCGGGEIEFVDFSSSRGDQLLSEMLEQNLIPDDKLSSII